MTTKTKDKEWSSITTAGAAPVGAITMETYRVECNGRSEHVNSMEEALGVARVMEEGGRAGDTITLVRVMDIVLRQMVVGDRGRIRGQS